MGMVNCTWLGVRVRVSGKVKVGVGVGVRVGYGVRASDPQPELLSVGYGELHLDVGAMVLTY